MLLVFLLLFNFTPVMFNFTSVMYTHNGVAVPYIDQTMGIQHLYWIKIQLMW